MRKAAAIILSILSILLLALNGVGVVMPRASKAPLMPYTAPRHYYENILTFDQVHAEFTKVQNSTDLPGTKAHRLFELVRDGYLHGPSSGYLIEPWDNWIVWIAGQFNQRRLQSQDAHLLLKRGMGFCDQAAMIFTSFAHEVGLPARLLWLSGHVVSEVLLPTGWKVVDSDLGIFWDAPLEAFGTSLSAEDIRQTILSNGFDAALADTITHAYVTQADNRKSAYPYLPTWYRQEQIARLATWVIPILLLAVGVLMLRKGSVREAPIPSSGVD